MKTPKTEVEIAVQSAYEFCGPSGGDRMTAQNDAAAAVVVAQGAAGTLLRTGAAPDFVYWWRHPGGLTVREHAGTWATAPADLRARLEAVREEAP